MVVVRSSTASFDLTSLLIDPAHCLPNNPAMRQPPLRQAKTSVDRSEIRDCYADDRWK
jgi:hypothetical protein